MKDRDNKFGVLMVKKIPVTTFKYGLKRKNELFMWVASAMWHATFAPRAARLWICDGVDPPTTLY
jgi:hypothetical protein